VRRDRKDSAVTLVILEFPVTLVYLDIQVRVYQDIVDSAAIVG